MNKARQLKREQRRLKRLMTSKRNALIQRIATGEIAVFPAYKFCAASKGNRNQIRACLPGSGGRIATHHEHGELRTLAINLVLLHMAWPCRVAFFGDARALDNWDGTGAMNDTAFDSWIADAVVDTDRIVVNMAPKGAAEQS